MCCGCGGGEVQWEGCRHGRKSDGIGDDDDACDGGALGFFATRKRLWRTFWWRRLWLWR